jgi:hypothetical protein
MEDSLSASSTISCRHDLVGESRLARSLAEILNRRPAFVNPLSANGAFS